MFFYVNYAIIYIVKFRNPKSFLIKSWRITLQDEYQGGIKMTESTMQTTTADTQLLSKSAINLPPKERLELLLKCKRYPIVKKKTSSEKQLKEMIDFYNLCSIILAKYFPTEQAENNFMLLSILDSQEETPSITDEQLSRAFRLLHSYEEFENRITATQALFYQYHESFPDLYEEYNLEDISKQSIHDIIESGRYLLIEDVSSVKKLLERWGIS